MTQPCGAECIAFGAFSWTAVGQAATAALTEEELSDDDEEAADEEQKGMAALVGVRAHLNIFLEASYALMVALGLKDIEATPMHATLENRCCSRCSVRNALNGPCNNVLDSCGKVAVLFCQCLVRQ